MKPKNEKFNQFPSKFYWGSATSSHQVEGGNKNNWTQWEKQNASRLKKQSSKYWQEWQQKKFPEMFQKENYISGKACDHYNLYERDFDLIKSMGHNTYRFSVEWSRIEPREGEFNEKEIEHYKEVVKALKKRNIEPFITLWHYTNPIWIEKKGGVKGKKFPNYFRRYVENIVGNLKSEVRFWVTFNEPTVLILNSYIRGIWPPQKKSFLAAEKCYRNFSKAHNKAYDTIHNIRSDAQVGITNLINFLEPYRKSNILDKLAVSFIEYCNKGRLYQMTKGKKDFIGVQYYHHLKVQFPKIVRNENRIVSDMGWEIYPQGIYHMLKDLKKYSLPIYITENGIADACDRKRKKFIKDHLKWIHKAIQEGVDVRGYFYWSLLDNFEWDKGFWPRFGLLEVDHATQERKMRPSAQEYSKIITNNGFYW